MIGPHTIGLVKKSVAEIPVGTTFAVPVTLDRLPKADVAPDAETPVASAPADTDSLPSVAVADTVEAKASAPGNDAKGTSVMA